MAFQWEQPGRILYLPLRQVVPSRGARGQTTVQLQELAASIAQVGILQPLTVRKARKDGAQYVVVSGNRRLMAARIAGLGEVPCILLSVDEADAELIALTENLQREDLHYFDEAECLQQYVNRSGLTQSQAAKRLGRSQPALANKLRLLNHSPRVRQALRDFGLSERHARELLRLGGETLRLRALAEIVEKRLSVAQTERYIENLLQNGQGKTEKFRRRDTRLFLERVSRDAAQLRLSGVETDLRRQDESGEIVLTVRIEAPVE